MFFLVLENFLEMEFFPLREYLKEVTCRFLLMRKQVWAQIPSATNISSAGEEQQMLIWKPDEVHL